MTQKITLYLLIISVLVSPLYIIRWRIFGIPTTFFELSLLATIISFIIYLIGSDNPKKIFLGIIKDPFFLPIISLLTAGFLALFVTSDLKGGLGIFKAYIVEPIIIYFIFRQINLSEKNFLITLAFFATFFWLSIIAVLQITTGHFVFFAPSEISQGRVTAVFNSANSLALFSGPILALAIANIEERKFLRIIAITTCIVALIIIYLTRSQGSYVATLATFIVVFSLKYASKKLPEIYLKRVIILLYLLIALFGLLLPLGAHFLDNFTPSTTNNNYKGTNTFIIRNYIWAGTFDILWDKPIFGVGLNGFKTAYFNNYRLPQYHEALQYPHNIYLNFWSELGILGLISFFVIIRKLILITISNKRINLGLIAFLTYFLVHGVVDVPYLKNDLSFQFWMIVALLI